MSQMMTIHPNIEIDRDRLRALCQQWQIIELALFGSVLRDDFRPDSDVDLLVTWHEQSHWTLLDFAQMHEDFAQLLDRPVDLVSKRAIESSNNPLRREAILNTAQPIYQRNGSKTPSF
ncbi:nucleotidyltransferase domain-containing protein [Roseofilum sp. BLCC_M154]|uniref:Nucleotidyltransferase domain-containing protein n=1 Tax=Roseofilum acuticapitatum BLCC-M154 TaxID=3022444 RepID=A0ABT7AX99_9CYAN|nr:nucleotidyltransferase domain-containing protein [Roseofilum acuticapitatum]MDJ1171549.1 nucleotidyltransferase domain-containing protein [Roseofilum acuticapitatum BLCC-M154]